MIRPCVAQVELYNLGQRLETPLRWLFLHAEQQLEASQRFRSIGVALVPGGYVLRLLAVVVVILRALLRRVDVFVNLRIVVRFGLCVNLLLHFLPTPRDSLHLLLLAPLSLRMVIKLALPRECLSPPLLLRLPQQTLLLRMTRLRSRRRLSKIGGGQPHGDVFSVLPEQGSRRFQITVRPVQQLQPLRVLEHRGGRSAEREQRILDGEAQPIHARDDRQLAWLREDHKVIVIWEPAAREQPARLADCRVGARQRDGVAARVVRVDSASNADHRCRTHSQHLVAHHILRDGGFRPHRAGVIAPVHPQVGGRP